MCLFFLFVCFFFLFFFLSGGVVGVMRLLFRANRQR